MVVPFLDSAGAASVAEAARRGFATALALQDPPIVLAFSRADEATGEVHPIGAWAVTISVGGQSPREDGGETAEQVASQGTMRAWEPFPVQKDDTFVLPDGGTGVVIAALPPRFGIGRIVFRLAG